MKPLLILTALLFSQSTLFAATSPTTVFSPYVDLTLNTHWDYETQDLQPEDWTAIANQHGLKSLHLAFITDSGVCQPAWGGQDAYSIDKQWAKRLTDSMQTNGIELVISLGGAAGNDLSAYCGESQLANQLNKIVTTYHPAVLDFDIENGTANVPRLIKALSVLQQQHPDTKLGFTLPVMPEGLTAQGEAIVNDAKAAGLTFHVNIMAMDYGPSYDGDMGEYAIQAATQLHTFLTRVYPNKTNQSLWGLIEVTPMIGVNDVNNEQFTLKNAYDLKQFSQANGLGGLAMWSLSRDKPCADKWTSSYCSGNNLQQTAYEFSNIFM